MNQEDIPVFTVERSRTGLGRVWNQWRYEAREEGRTSSVRNVDMEDYHSSLDSLAKSVAEHPYAHGSVFIPGSITGNGPRVSLIVGVKTQWGTVTDDELGQLGSLVQKYVESKERQLA